MEGLAKSIREKKTILFAGSGVSAGLGVPTWSGLMRHIAEELECDPDVLIRPDTNYLTLAEYYRIKKGSIGALRSWMDRNWNSDDDKISNSEVHSAIFELDFPIIYTTNYDSNIEKYYDLKNKSYTKITDVRGIADHRDGFTQIVKFHGDFEDDNSIVLTEGDYFRRLSFESPLDIKLRADVLGKSILFIGYSLNDVNVRLLLHKLWAAWEQSGNAKHKPKSYIFLGKPDPIQSEVLAQWGVEPIESDEDDPGKGLINILRKLK